MKQFEYYEFIAILIPGVILLYGLSMVFPEIGPILSKDISVGEFGLFFILAFAFGHLSQAFGNALENAYWGIIGGWPTDWVRSGKHYLIGSVEREQLEKKIMLHFDAPELIIKNICKKDWKATSARIYSAIEKANLQKKTDIYNSTYGLFRGLSVSFLLLIAAIPFKSISFWPWVVLLLALFGISIYRMHRFGRYYARELFTQFLQLNNNGIKKMALDED